MILAAFMVACGSDTSPKTQPTTVGAVTPAAEPEPTPRTTNDLAEEFGCQWIMDTYRQMASRGRDMAVEHVSTSMSLKEAGMEYIAESDAAEAVRWCEAEGYQ